MARNLSHNLKRVVAGLCAVLVVAGAVPAQPIADIFSSSVITVSAATTYTTSQSNLDWVSGDIFVCNGSTYTFKQGGADDFLGVKNKSDGYPSKATASISGNTLTINGANYTLSGSNNAWRLENTESDYDYGHYYRTWEFTETYVNPVSKDASYSSTTSFTYNGSEKTAVTGSNVDITGTYKATNAGDYTAYVKPKDGHAWSDGTTDQKTVNWSIGKAANPLTYTGTQSVTKTFRTISQTATLTAASNAQGTLSYSITSGNTNNYFSLNSTGTTLTIAANTPAGTYKPVITAKAAGNSNYNEGSKTSTVTVKIDKANISPSVSILNWTYGENAKSPSVSDNTGNGTVTYQYKLSTAADNTYTNTVPTKAGNYTVKATVPETTNYKGNTATTNFTISRKVLNLSWSDLSLPYTGSPQIPSCTATNLKSGDTVNISVTGAATNVGSHTATASSISGTGSDNYELPTVKTETYNITAVAPTVTAPTAKTGLVYNGSGQALINAGSTSGGTIKYLVTENSTQPDKNAEGWSESVPSKAGAGTYYVWYYVAGDSNHNDSDVDKVTVTIAQAANSITAPTAKNLTFNGNSQALVNAGEADHGDLYYYVGESAPEETGSEWKTAIPTATDAGTYKVWTMAKDSANNYKTVISTTAVEVTIAQKDISNAIVFLSSNSVSDGSTHPNVLYVLLLDIAKMASVDTDCTVTYPDTTGKTDGVYYITVSGKGNYTGEKQVEYVIGNDFRKAEIELTHTEFDYTGAQIKPEYTVRFDGNALSSDYYEVTYDNDRSVGTRTVTFTGKNGYSGVQKLTFTINARSLSDSAVVVKKITNDDNSDVDYTGNNELTFTGEPLAPKFKLYNTASGEDVELTEDADYTLFYNNNTEPGLAVVKVSSEGTNYKSSMTLNFNIIGVIGDNANTNAEVTQSIQLIDNDTINNDSFTSANMSVLFNGKKLTLNRDYKVTSCTLADDKKSGTVTIEGIGVSEGSFYSGSKTLDFKVQNTSQTLTVDDEISDNVSIGNEANAKEYTLIVGNSYTIVNNTGTVLTVKGTSTDEDVTVPDQTIPVGKSITLTVADRVDYSIATHVHNFNKVTNENGRIYATCSDGDLDDTLLAEIAFKINGVDKGFDENSFTYGNTIIPQINTKDGEGAKITSSQYTVKDSAGRSVETEKLSESNVGAYTVEATIVYNGATYDFSRTFEITPKAIILTPDAGQKKTYGEDDPTQFTYTTDGLIAKDADSVRFDQYIKRANGENVGEYAYELTSYNDGSTTAKTVGNYTISLSDESPKFLIAHRAITLTPDEGQEKTYGVADSGFTCTTDDAVAKSEHQNFNEYIGRVPGENVGEYAYTITDGDGIIGNYSISLVSDSPKFTIKQKDISGLFTQDQTEFTYNGEAQTLTVTGNYADETAGITKTLALDTDYEISGNVQTDVNRTGTEEVGIYAATVTGNGNYTGEVTFTYKINPKDIASDATVTLALDHTSYTYQTNVINDPILTVTDTARNVVLTGVDYTSDLAGKELVGSYTVTVEGLGNYTGIKTVGWTIEKADVDITVDEKTGGITYDASAVDVSDFVVIENNSDTNDYALTYYDDNNGEKGAEIDAPTNAGKYWVEASIAETDNFNAAEKAVQFTINKAAARITPEAGQSQVYGDKTENLAFSVDGLQGTDTKELVFEINPLMVVDSDNSRLTDDHILQVDGSYYLTVDPSKTYGNYRIEQNGENAAYTVTKKSIAVVSDDDITITSDTRFVYDGTSHAVEYQSKDHVYNYGGTAVETDLADGTDYIVAGRNGTNAKEYNLQFLGQGNYENVKVLPWIITNKAIAANIVAQTDDLTYNGQNVGGNFSVNTVDNEELPEGAAVTLTYKGREGTAYEESTTAPSNAGKYTVTATATLKNYAITFAENYDFEIKQKIVTVIPDAGQTKVYGTAAPEITYILDGVISGEDVDFASGIVSVDCAQWADVTDTGYVYSITEADQGNYALVLNAADTFMVTPKDINEITFDLDTDKIPIVNNVADARAHVVAKYGEKTLEQDTDYTLESETKSFVTGDFEMIARGKGNYTGNKDIAWSAVENVPVVVRARNVFFDGQLSLVMKFVVPDEILADEDAYIEYSWLDGTELRTERELIKDLETGIVGNNEKVWLVESSVYAPEMQNKVTYKFYHGDNTQIALTDVTGTESYDEGYQFSFDDYLDLAINSSNESLRDLAKAAKDYGKAAQIHFKYGDYGTVELDPSSVQLSALNIYKAKDSGSLPELIDSVKMSVDFDRDNTLYVKFNFSEAPTQEQLQTLTCTVDDNPSELEKLSDTTYALVVRSVASPHLDTEHTFTISDATNTFTTKRSVLSYAYAGIENGSDTLKELCKALYLYNQAANIRFGE